MTKYVPALALALATAFALATPATATADARDDKVQLYIEVHNQFSSGMHARYERYTAALQGLNAEAPCQGEQNPGAAIYHAGDATGTIRGFRTRLRRRPQLPMDAQVTAMLDAAAAELPAWNGAYAYYHRRGHLEDGCAEGNRLHATLMESYRAFQAADRDLLAFLDQESRAAHERELVQVEREHGQGFRLAQVRIVGQFTALRDLLQTPQPDLAELGRILDAIEGLKNAAQTLVDGASDEVRSDLYQGHYNMFLQRCDTLVRQGRALIETMQNPRADANRRERAVSAFQRAHEDAIRVSNSVGYSRRVH